MTHKFTGKLTKHRARGRRISATLAAFACAALAFACLTSRFAPASRAQGEGAKSQAEKSAAGGDASATQVSIAPRLVASFEGYGGPRSVGRGALVLFSPDSRLLALSAPVMNVKVYDTATGALRCAIESPRDWFNAFSFMPDSRTAATRDWEDHTVRLWDMSDGKELLKWSGRGGMDFEMLWKVKALPAEEYFAVPMSRDGRTVLAETEDDVMVAFEAASGRKLFTLDHRTESNRAKDFLKGFVRGKQRELYMRATYSPDGRLILTANGDAFPKLWDAETGQAVATLDAHGDVYNAVFSPDGLT